MRRLTLTQQDIPSLQRAIKEGAATMSGGVVFKDVLMDHRMAHHILDALLDGEEKLDIYYEDWQIAGPAAMKGEIVEVAV